MEIAPPHIRSDGGQSSLWRLPVDIYQRYSVSRDVIQLVYGARQLPLRVLDVGGHAGPLKHILPDDRVVVTDVQQAPDQLELASGITFAFDDYLLAAGQSLPFADRSFDVVTSHDTLEHVPPPHRLEVVREMLRVARGLVILNGPMHNRDTARAEQRLATFMRRALDWEHPYLTEHLAYGLPKEAEVESLLRAEGAPFISVPNGNLMLWLLMMAIEFHLAPRPEARDLMEAVHEAYNELLSPTDFHGLCYRRAYVIATGERQAESLALVQTAFAAHSATVATAGDDESAPVEAFAALDKLLHALEGHTAQTTAAGNAREAAFADATERLARAEHDLQEHSRLLVAYRSSLEAKTAAVESLGEALSQTEASLRSLQAAYQAVTGSFGYRLLERYRRFVRWLFPADSWRGFPYRAIRAGLRPFLGGRGALPTMGRAARAWRRYGTRTLVAKSIQHLSRQSTEPLDPVKYALDVDWGDKPAPEPRVGGPVNVDALSINWILPTVSEGGGYRTIFRFVEHLQRQGHQQRIYEMPVGIPRRTSSGELKSVVRRLYGLSGIDVHHDFEQMESCDIALATSWHTAYPLAQFAGAREKCYFVQDFEAFFAPVGTESAVAENTYRFGFHGITAGRWLAEKLTAEYGMDCAHFNLAVDSQAYFPMDLPKRNKIFFYARPATPRRGYELGLKALEIFHAGNPQYEIILAGGEVFDRAFTFPVTNLGFIGEDRLNTLYNQSAAALVVSLTNCSLLPLEIMATGCPVVVTAGENNEKILPPDSAIFALASPHHLAKALEQAVKHPPKQEDLIAAAHQFSWEAETARVEAILKRIALARAGS